MGDSSVARKDQYSTDLSSVSLGFEQEARLAVVLYGGVSLAIYINGVAQELLRLVRATAPDNVSPKPGEAPSFGESLIKEKDLKGVERVYRELGRRVGITQDFGPIPEPGSRIRTRFVVDVLSGTSAGGINAIFLAKALANHQNLTELRNLWLNQGEIDVLLNDSGSLRGMRDRLRDRRRPDSLLNGNRMYWHLREAFRGLDPNPEPDPRWESPLVDELDLFVTATDLCGLPVPIRLSDKVVFERRYKNVFHFLFATSGATGDRHNDFVRENNAFLAFAARCTSSFPVAFEPMMLEDIERAASEPEDRSDFDSKLARWSGFFRDYLRPHLGTGPPMPAKLSRFEKRAFGDGGYLDNKPFTHAIRALQWRRAGLRVDRKLFYVEPSPEHPELGMTPEERPDPVANLIAASSSLPRAETIREDLEKVVERNRAIQRMLRVTRSADKDVQTWFKGDRPKPEEGSDWAKIWLDKLIKQRGAAYGGHHRLKVAELTTEIAEVVTRAAGLDDESDDLLAMRYLISAWRQENYKQDKDDSGPAQRSENELLMDFDLSFRLRRLHFVQNQLDQMLEMSERAAPLLQAVGARLVKLDGAGRGAARFGAAEESVRLSLTFANPMAFPAWESEVIMLKRRLARVQVFLRRAGRRLRSRGDRTRLHGMVLQLGISRYDLLQVLRSMSERDRTEAARLLLGYEPRMASTDQSVKRPAGDCRRVQVLEECVRHLSGRLKRVFVNAAGACKRILGDGAALTEASSMGALVHACAHYAYDNYDWHDMILFPMLYGAEIGEPAEVDVVRVSPEDATTLIRERDEVSGHPYCKKLAGTRFGNFGAFLDRTWRESDILWGRLDTAERIIRAYMPLAGNATTAEAQAVDGMIGRAQAAIVCEELSEYGGEHARRVLVEALLHTATDTPDEASLRFVLARLHRYLEQPTGLADSPDEKELKQRMVKMLAEPDVMTAYRDAFRCDREWRRDQKLRVMARATQILGRMLDTLSDRHVLVRKRFAAAVLWVGRAFFGLVEVAIPRSFWSVVFRHWLWLLYGFELVLIAAALAFNIKEMNTLGVKLLLCTAGADVLHLLLRAYLKRRNGWLYAALLVALVALALSAYLGLPILKQRVTQPVRSTFRALAARIYPRPDSAGTIPEATHKP